MRFGKWKNRRDHYFPEVVHSGEQANVRFTESSWEWLALILKLKWHMAASLTLTHGLSPGVKASVFHYSVAKSCPTLCDLMDCSMPGFHVLHSPLKFAQICIHWVSDAIQQSYPLLSPSPPVLNLSQHLGFLFFFFLNEMTICIRWYIKAYIEWFLFSWTMNELLLSPDKQEFKNWNLWFYQIYKHFSITFVQINKLFVYWDHCAFLIFPWYLSQAVWLGLEVLMP